MAEAEIGYLAPSGWPNLRPGAFARWTGGARLFRRLCSGRLQHGPTDDAAGLNKPGPRLATPSVDEGPNLFPLLNAYAASAIEIARRADSLDLCAIGLGPVAIQALIGDVVQALEPLARKAGLTLLRDAGSRSDGVCCADSDHLKLVVSHLLLRALCLEQSPGHIRVMVTLSSHEAQIIILSRTPEVMSAALADAARRDLIAPQRIVQAMGGSLILEPRRAGYLPLCIALPALSASPAVQAA